MKYVITGINRLTKEREIISSPAERQDIERLIAKLREEYERDNFGGGMIRMAESCHAASASVKMAFKKKPWVMIIKIVKR